MKVEHASGPNFVIDIDDGVARCRVWQRPDLSSAEGAACAEQISQQAESLATDSRVRGFVFDLREAPPVAGPRTVTAIGEMARAYERAGKTFEILAADAPMMLLQFRRVIRETAPTWGQVTTRAPEADSAAQRGPKSR